jgi:hypothetical protein
VLVAALAACGGKKDAATVATTTTTAGGATSTAGAGSGSTTTSAGGSSGGVTSTTVFPSDALDVCDMLVRNDPSNMLQAPPTAEPLHGTASKSRGSCEIRTESTQLRVAQFPLEEMADAAKAFSDAKPCEPLANGNPFPEECRQTPTGGFFVPFQAGTALQLVAVKASGSGIKPMAGTVDAKGVIVLSGGLETAKAQRSAGVLLGLL